MSTQRATSDTFFCTAIGTVGAGRIRLRISNDNFVLFLPNVGVEDSLEVAASMMTFMNPHLAVAISSEMVLQCAVLK